MNDEILIYIKRDEQDSIVSISSDIFIDDLTGWEKVDEWIDGEDRYIYAHADNGEYVQLFHEKPLYDENGIPNFHDDWIEWTEEEKAEKYPPAKPQPTEQDLINADIYLQLAQLQMNSISVITIQSPRYDILKGYYDMGIYDNENMVVFVNCGWISSQEYEQITSRKYQADML
nr:MAG TPA: hypothetical protein [Caudoviricetes sp.]